MTQSPSQNKRGFLFDVRVLELADEKGEFCGKLLAGAGADVVKIEPPEGNRTRGIGPFYQDSGDPEQSLHFWHYNFGKRGITLDIAKDQGQQVLKDLVSEFDVLVESYPPGYMASLGLGYEDLRTINPRLIVVSITPFGQSGPWRDFKSSDLVQLALGGEMMVCGYEPRLDGEYDTPPIAPQMWHASHIACNHAYLATVAALFHREWSGQGQHLDVSMHQAANTNTEMDIPFMVYNRMPLLRQTGRHAMPKITVNSQAMTRDGRYLWCSTGIGAGLQNIIDLLEEDDAAEDLSDPKYKDPAIAASPDTAQHAMDITKRWVNKFKFDDQIWKRGQDHKMHWVPIRKPEENLDDSNWKARKTFTQVYHEDIDKTLTYNGAPWLAEHCPWRTGPRAPHKGEHNQEVLGRDLGLSGEQLKELRDAGVI